MQLQKMERRIKEIKGKLTLVGEMRPGSLNEPLTVCGKLNCRCKDPQRPKKHGPYYQLSYVHNGKSTSQYIQKEFLGAVRSQLANFKRFKALTTEWVDIALALAKEKLQADKERHKSKTRPIKQQQRARSGTRSRGTTR